MTVPRASFTHSVIQNFEVLGMVHLRSGEYLDPNRVEDKPCTF